MNTSRQQPLAFWKMIVTSFLLWPAALKKVLPFAIIMSLLNYMMGHFLAPQSESSGWHFITYISLTIFVTLIGVTFYTATLCRINSIFKGSEISLRDAILRGLKKLWDQCVISIVLFGTLALLLTPCFMIVLFAIRHEWEILAFLMEGVFTIIVLGFFYFLVRFTFASIIMALKDFKQTLSLKLRVKTCFRESYDLVKGYWWRTFGVLVIVIATSVVPMLLVTKLIKVMGPGSLMTLLFFLVQIAIFPLFSTFMLVLFYDLQTRRLRSI